MRKHEAKSIGELLKVFTNKYNYDDHLTLHNLKTEWKNIVGPTIAKNVRPVSFKNNILHLHTESAVWRNELLYCKAGIITKINSIFPDLHLDDITF